MTFRFRSIFSLVVLTSLAARGTAEANLCKATAQDAFHSCEVGAHSDFWLSRGKCANVSDSAERKDCRQKAFSDLKDALDVCDSEASVRQNACQRLGPQAYDPVIDPANFVDKIDNPYFPLTPGTVFIYEGRTTAGLERDEFFVTHKTKQILGVTTVEVHDTVTTNGKLTEDTLDWFAQDKEGNVWYFGENTMELINGRPSTLEGTFVAGVNRAKPGIIMEAHSVVHDFYRQEFDLGNAEDFADVKSVSDTVTGPYGTFTHCLRTRETTPLEPDLKEAKWYAPGVGNVLTRDLTTGEKRALVRIEFR
jgi:hypothetical protein